MNKTVTSKEAILAASKTLLLEKGAAAFNMRGVAESCGIAVGSLYNYFPSKSALVSATIESIWIDIFRSFITAPAFASFADCADALCTALSEGEERHPGFFTLHALSFAASDKAEGRALMARGFATLRAKMCGRWRWPGSISPASLPALKPKTPRPDDRSRRSLFFARQTAFFPLARDNVTDRCDRMDKEHARRAVAHDYADGFAHLRLVTMHAAVAAEGLCLHERTVVAAVARILRQTRTRFAERAFRRAVMMVAVECDHLPHHRFFTLAFFDKVSHRDTSFDCLLCPSV